MLVEAFADINFTLQILLPHTRGMKLLDIMNNVTTMAKDD